MEKVHHIWATENPPHLPQGIDNIPHNTEREAHAEYFRGPKVNSVNGTLTFLQATQNSAQSPQIQVFPSAGDLLHPSLWKRGLVHETSV